jgi:hypothetical protein
VPTCNKWLVLFLVLASLWTRSAQAADTARCESRSTLDLLSDFYSLSGDLPSRYTELRAALERDHADVSILVATVPEPRLGFDGSVEAITSSLGEAGFTLSRYGLPWAAGNNQTAGCQAEQPGRALLVNSARAGQRSLLVLYLVSESPTAGVQHAPFLAALQEIADLRDQLPPDRCVACNPLPLLGPSFSGSVASLEQLLEQPVAARLSFTIISGRATDGSIQAALEAHSRPERTVSFKATVIPDEVLQAEFYCYLTETMGADDHDIALLVESSTRYGRAVASAHQSAHSESNTGLRPGSRYQEGGSVRLGSRCKQPHHPRLLLPMPLHIGRLHAAWQQQSQGKPIEPKSGSDLLKQEFLPLLPKSIDLGDRADVIPTLSPTTVASTDRALAALLGSLSSEGIRYVGLLFTDPQDRLFLAEQVRRYAPDTVLFSFESDLAYTHPEVRPLLKGMLTVSPYPLFVRNQQWSYPFRGSWYRHQFARDLDQGVYNATAALIGRSDLMLEYSQPVARASERPRSRPSIWISAVGNETLFPLTFISDYSAGRYVFETTVAGDAVPLYIPNQQGTLSVLLLALGLVALILAIGYFRAYYAPPKEDLRFPFRPFNFFQARADDRGEAVSGSSRRPIYVLTMFLPMTLVYPLLITIHFVQLRDGNRVKQLLGGATWWLRLLHYNHHIGVYEGLTWRVLGIGLIAVICLCSMLLVTLDSSLALLGLGGRIRHWLRIKQSQRPSLMPVLLGLAAAAFALVLFQGFVRLVNFMQWDFNNMVFLRRAAHPAYGLSPITPLAILVGGLLLWGYSNLQRLRLGVRPSPDFLRLVGELRSDNDLSIDLLTIADEQQPPHRLYRVATLLVALVLAASVFSDLTSLERQPLNLAFRLLFALLSAAILFAGYRSLRTWLHFREFLLALSHHPLITAFDRMPDTFARSVGSLFLESLPERARIEAEHNHLRLLSNHLRMLDVPTELANLPGGQSQSQNLERLFASLRTAIDTPGAGTPAQVGDTFAHTLAEILHVFWHNRPMSRAAITAASMTPQRSAAEIYAQALPDGLSVWLRLGEEFIAMRVVAFIYSLFPYLRNTLLFVTSGLLVLLATLISYPFQPQRFLVLFMSALMLAGAALAVMIVVQMNRSEVLSRVAKSEPGKLTVDRHFLSRVIVYAVLPLLSILASQFPQVRGFAFSWLETILKTLK